MTPVSEPLAAHARARGNEWTTARSFMVSKFLLHLQVMWR